VTGINVAMDGQKQVQNKKQFSEELVKTKRNSSPEKRIIE
jgi:hypothetical protein